MKKFWTIIILICIINCYNPTFASDYNNYKIEKTNKKYELIDKISKTNILPYKYDKIRKLKYEDKTIFLAENKNYITLYSPDGLYNDFTKKYYLSNKYNQNIIFKNYPENAVITYTQNKKYGFIIVDNGILHVVKPIFSKISYPDDTSTASKLLNISFAAYENIYAYYNYGGSNYYFLTVKDILENLSQKTNSYPIVQNKQYINEKITLADNSLYIEFKGIEPFEAKAISENTIKINLTDLYSLEDLYEYINKNTAFTFKHYPYNGTVQAGHRIYAFQDGIKYDIVVPCSEYYRQPSFLSALTGLNINFNNQEQIISKNGNWGIINKNNEIKTPFIYDAIYPLINTNREEIKSTGNKTVIEYKHTGGNKYFLAKKGYGWGIINADNEIIVPFDYKRSKDSTELALLKEQINKKIRLDENRNERMKAKENLPYLIMDLIFLPLWIILPFPISGYIDIDYF